MQLLFNAPLRLGELYMDGRFVILQGTIYDLLLTVTRNLASQSSARLQKLLSHARTALGPLHQRNNKNRAKRNAAHHYDLDSRLYDLLLDSDRQYSCAYF